MGSLGVAGGSQSFYQSSVKMVHFTTSGLQGIAGEKQSLVKEWSALFLVTLATLSPLSDSCGAIASMQLLNCLCAVGIACKLCSWVDICVPSRLLLRHVHVASLASR